MLPNLLVTFYEKLNKENPTKSEMEGHPNFVINVPQLQFSLSLSCRPDLPPCTWQCCKCLWKWWPFCCDWKSIPTSVTIKDALPSIWSSKAHSARPRPRPQTNVRIMCILDYCLLHRQRRCDCISNENHSDGSISDGPLASFSYFSCSLSRR